MEEAFQKHKEVTVVVNFASFRSVYETVMETLEYSEQIKTIGTYYGPYCDDPVAQTIH